MEDFLSGYRNRENQMRQGALSKLQMTGEIQGMLAKQQEAERQAQIRGVLSSTANPEEAIPKLIQAGAIREAGVLGELVKDMRQPKVQAPPTRTLVSGNDQVQQELQPDGSWREVGRGSRFAPQAPVPQRAPPSRNRIEGGIQIQEEMQPDGTWKEIGRGERFAKQIAPAPGSVSGGTTLHTQGTLDPEAIKDLAIQSLYDPNATMGYRRDPRMMSQIANERVKLMREAGVTSEDVVSGRAGFKADTSSLNKITPQYDAITAFESTAVRNGKILKELATKADTTGVPVVERWIRAGRNAIAGDPDVAKFNAQMNLYRAEAARILTQPNLSGVLTDTARKEMEEVIRNSASAKQIVEVVDLLERDFKNRKETLEEQIASIRARMRTRASPGGGGDMAAKPAAPTSTGAFSDAEKERRYQEWKARQQPKP